MFGMKDADQLVLCDQFALEVGKCGIAELDRCSRFLLSYELYRRVFAGLSYVGMPIIVIPLSPVGIASFLPCIRQLEGLGR
jgi:hypothetical protein